MRFGKDPNAVLICEYGKDGGPESRVYGFWLVRIKSLFTIALLRFEDGTRDAYHSHAFDCISWVLRGELLEEFWFGCPRLHRPSLRPIITRRTDYHRVKSCGRTWVFTIRGPWIDTWRELRPVGMGRYTEVELTHGRKELAS